MNRLRKYAARVSLHLSTGSLRGLVLRGTVWTLVGYGASQALRLAGNLILTRLLYPQLFGVMALVSTFLVGLALLSDLGIGSSIVQNKRGMEPLFLNTAWTIQVGRGIFLWSLSFLIAIPFAQFYNEPQLRLLIPIASLGALLADLNATSLHTLRRELRVGILTRVEFAAQTGGLVVMLAWAWLVPGIWALVAGGLATAGVRLVASFWLRGTVRNRLAWDPAAARAIWTFGKWIFLSSAVTFFAEQSDTLMLGKIAPLEILGIYGIALTFAEVPRQVTLVVAGNVLFPGLALLREVPRPELREKISRNRMGVLLLLAGGLTLLAGLGDLLIRFFYDVRYWQAAWMLPLLAVGLWPRLLCNTIEPALFAIGKPQYSTAAQIGRVVWTVAGILFGYAWLGVLGAVLAITLNDLIYYAIVNYGLRREGLSDLRHDAQATLAFVLFLGVFMSIRWLVGLGLPSYA